MSDRLYSTCLRWSALQREGIAKLRGRVVRLTTWDGIPGIDGVIAVDYVPEIRRGRILRLGHAWADMSDDEKRAADRMLIEVVNEN